MRIRTLPVVEIFHTGRANSILGAVYLAVLNAVLAAYLFMALLREEGYSPGLYRNTYVYFMVFDLLLFSLLAPFWDAGGRPLRTWAGMAVMAVSPLPLILAIFMAGSLNPANFLQPLLLKAVWGLAVLSLGSCLEAGRPGWRWKGLITALFIFFILVLGGLLTYFYIEYRQAVITTLYDKDIAGAFFLNPLLSLAGLVYYQSGGGSQLGLLPFWGCVLFWGLAAALLRLAAVKIAGGGAAGD